MPTMDKKKDRPFGQSTNYDFNRLRPLWIGYHHKFILLIPISESILDEDVSKPVFIEEDLNNLKRLFRADFGGLSRPKDMKGALIEGEWFQDGTKNTIVNEHARFDIYTQRNEDSVEYFRELKERLHKHVRDVRKADQDIIVIEQSEVVFVSGLPKIRV